MGEYNGIFTSYNAFLDRKLASVATYTEGGKDYFLVVLQDGYALNVGTEARRAADLCDLVNVGAAAREYARDLRGWAAHERHYKTLLKIHDPEALRKQYEADDKAAFDAFERGLDP